MTNAIKALRAYVFLIILPLTTLRAQQTSEQPNSPNSQTQGIKAGATAQTQTPQAAPPPELGVDQVKKTVVFIQGSFQRMRPVGADATDQKLTNLSESGTGFLIFVPDSRLSNDRGITFLVTNKHVIRQPGPDPDDVLGRGPYFDYVVVRLNTKSPVDDQGDEFSILPVPVVDNRGYLTWIIDPKDPNTDLAIIPVRMDDPNSILRQCQ